VKPYIVIAYVLFFLVITITLTACDNKIQPTGSYNPEDAWTSQLNSIEISNMYNVNYYKTFSSSGGTRMWNYTYTVKNETVISCDGAFTNSYTDTYRRPCNISADNFITESTIKLALATYNADFFKKYDDTFCYYNITNPTQDPMKVFVCFNRNHIVSYGGKGGYGGIFMYWYLDGYNPDQELFVD
jgi:hypothetical protein